MREDAEWGSTTGDGGWAPERSALNHGVVGGIALLAIAGIWFYAGWQAGRIFYYPPILALLGVFGIVKGMAEGAWQGKVIGPLLRFGYRPSPVRPMPMEWLGAGNSLVRRDAYDQAGGFSDFFLHRCTMNEDVDLGLKLGRVGRIMLCPAARMAHMHAPAGRVAAAVAAEDDVHNRYLILRHTVGRSALSAFGSVCLYFAVETLSNIGGAVRRLRGGGFIARLAGRARALIRIVSLPRPNAD